MKTSGTRFGHEFLDPVLVEGPVNESTE
jgi:hypothetical protein